MYKILIMISSIALLAIGTAQANITTSKEYQQLVMKKMQLLADSQKYIDQEIDRHVERAIDIQRYQVCIQAANQQQKLKDCEINTLKN